MLKVACVKSGPGVLVEKFEGDGSGLTSSKDIDWRIGEDITFIVSGEYDDVSVISLNLNVNIDTC